MENPKPVPSLLLGIPIILKSYSVMEWFAPALDLANNKRADMSLSCPLAVCQPGRALAGRRAQRLVVRVAKFLRLIAFPRGMAKLLFLQELET